MTKPNIPQEQSPIFKKNPSHNNSIKLVSEILKHTNQLIQKGDLDRAQGELLLANRAAKEQYRKTTITSPVNEKYVAPLAPLPLAPMEAMMASISSQQQASAVLPHTTKQISKVQKSEQTNDRNIEINCYREALAEAWRDGALTQDEERSLQELRTVLEILDVEHESFEKETKCACYKEALTKHLSNDSATLSDGKILAELQKTFHISQEEYLQIQKIFMQTTQLKQNDKILIIDDDTSFLNMLSISMAEDGFDVTAVATSDEAYTLLQGHIYDLILCDVNLKTSTMNGFVFYEKVQGNKQLQRIPFLFLTGLRDEKLACTGKELGADDYLMKPISRDTLLSALHGRIKRFRQLREFPAYPATAFG